MEQRVMEGAEPFRFEGNGTGVLVSHGFTGTTQSVRPLGEALAEEGFTVMGPRITGHGTSMKDHAQSTALGWISSIEEGLTWLGQRTHTIFFAGLSMGGMFALYFAATRPELIRGIVPINACVFLNDPDLARIVFDPQAPTTVPGVGSDIKAEGVEDLILQSTEDHVVPPENGPHILEKLDSEDKELVWLENSYHVATLDNDADLIAERTVRFIRDHEGAP
ncbi:MAG: alpha/beta fold hydrolase [Actinobacteria bacterium]|nr:alpha/beta fold hydrolase [Actinomycetota bacterium]